jgi:hypothetical protein
MGPDVVKGESLTEFFRCLVDDAITHQKVDALELTRYYLVQLLTGHARCGTRADGAASDEPLALWFARALESGGSRQRSELRGLADHALFVSGFFSDSLVRSAVDVDYYASLGGYAYQQLSVWESDTLSPVYLELGHRFMAFADILAEVSEHSGLTSDRDLLRLYERWVQFGSTRHQERLRRRGITPTAQARTARIRVQ